MLSPTFNTANIAIPRRSLQIVAEVSIISIKSKLGALEQGQMKQKAMVRGMLKENYACHVHLLEDNTSNISVAWREIDKY
jgi:hypothetical protein